MSNLSKTSRRSVLRGLATAPAAAGSLAGLAVATAADAATSPDAELLAIVDLWKESAAAVDTAFDCVEALSESIEHVPIPPALLYQPEDGPHMRYLSTELEDGRRRYECGTVEHFRANYVGAIPDPYPWAEASFRRLGEIIAAHDAREAEFERRCVVSGLRAAEADLDELRDVAESFRTSIARTQALTFEGILAKAAVAAECAGGRDAIIMDFEREFLEAPNAPDTVLKASLLVDLARMAAARAH